MWTRARGLATSSRSRSSSSHEWLRRQRNDPYVKRAAQDQYVARSAYKLLQIDNKLKLLKKGMTVVDCGARPGGWTQVAVERVGSRGIVLAIDLHTMSPISGAIVIDNSDFRETATQHKISEALGERQVDVILSDMAPNTSGHADLDFLRIEELAESVLDFSSVHLRVGGHTVIKMFGGGSDANLRNKCKELFKSVRIMKPDASRKDSSEYYLACLDRRGSS